MSRTKRATETPEYAQFARRVLRAYGRRVAEADEADIYEMVKMLEEFEGITQQAIAGYLQSQADLPGRMRTRTWASIGKLFGVSKQAAEQRWSPAARQRQAAAQARYRARKDERPRAATLSS